MRRFLILLVALVVTVGLCNGAAIEKGNETTTTEKVEPAPARPPSICPGSLCGRKRREVVKEENLVEPAPARPPSICPGSLCGRKRREVVKEENLAQNGLCNGQVSSLCSGRKKREVIQQEIPQGGSGCKGPLASLCSGTG